MMVEVICKCGKAFETTEKRIADGRGIYCSRRCMYDFRERPKGLKYKLVKENPTQFKKGLIPWNAGLRGKFSGKSYDGLHDWVHRNLGRPEACSKCGKTEGKLEWSNISGAYKPDLSDWQFLCKKCHCRYDYEFFGARKIFYDVGVRRPLAI